MPDEDIHFLSSKRLMTPDEIFLLAELFVALGVKKIRLTGGEPLVRKEFAEIAESLSKLPIELTLTTNAYLVDRYIDLLKKLQIGNINISLDSLNAKVFYELTKRNSFQQVWSNIELLLNKGFRLKLNAVAIAGYIEYELHDFIELTKNKSIHVRFIEFMPFDGNGWSSEKVISAAKMLEMVSSNYEVIKLTDEPHSTARKFRVKGYKGTFAFITTMSNHFCGECNRLRLTADGKIKNCLFGQEEFDLLTPLRAGENVAAIIKESLRKKHASLGGQFTNDYHKIESKTLHNRSMITIGG
jgi:GTP 3',8-cyclase